MEELDFDLIKPGVQLRVNSHSVDFKCKYNNNYICSFKKFRQENVQNEKTKKIASVINSELKRLKTHINVVQFIGTCFDDGGRLYLVTEFVVGVSLADFIKKDVSSISWSHKIKMMFQLSQGLEFLHINNFVHRNLRSSIVILDYDDGYCPKISDIALHEMQDAIDESEKISRTREELYWKAPEITTLTFSAGSKKADIFGFGCLIWELVSEENIKKFLNEILKGQLGSKVNTLPEDFRKLITTALSLRPEERPSAQELTISLHSLLGEQDSDAFSEEDTSTSFHQSSITSARDTATQISDHDLTALYTRGLEFNKNGEYTKAAKCFDLPAWANHAESQFHIGRYHLFGYGRERNLSLATKWLESASNLNHLEADFLLARTFQFGIRDSTRIDKDEAAYIFQKLSKKGHNDAKLSLAYCYEIGEGVDMDLSRALNIYQKLTVMGNSMAIYRLGRMFELGLGTEVNFPKAIELYSKGVELGNSHCFFQLARLYDLGRGVEKDHKTAFKCYLSATEKGHRFAMQYLAVCYERGMGTETDFQSSFKWYNESASRGNPKAQHSLGLMYDKGRKIPQDTTKAVYWYRKAAAGGDRYSQNNLGRCYHLGIGVSKSSTKAVSWYKKSSELGASQAQANLAGCFERGDGVDKDFDEAFRLYSLAAEQNNAHGLYKLGLCYENGTGTIIRLDKAQFYYQKASNLGSEKAKLRLNKLFEKPPSPPPREPYSEQLAIFSNGGGVDKPLPDFKVEFSNSPNKYQNRPLPKLDSRTSPNLNASPIIEPISDSLSNSYSNSPSAAGYSSSSDSKDDKQARPDTLLNALSMSLGGGGGASNISRSIAKRLDKLTAQRFDGKSISPPKFVPNLSKSNLSDKKTSPSSSSSAL